MGHSYYDTAQICLNGHVISEFASSQPQSNQKFCAQCGSETIMECPGCGTAIRGYHHVPDVFGIFGYNKPSYCYNCGEPFPWTVASLEAASELVEDLEALSQEEKQQLKESFPDLVKDTPRTAVAEGRFKRLTKKAGTGVVDSMRSILVDVVSEAVKKSIFEP